MSARLSVVCVATVVGCTVLAVLIGVVRYHRRLERIKLVLEDGRTYIVTIGKFVPPHAVQYRPAGYEFDRTRPTDFVDQLCSAPCIDPHEYVKLLDDGARAEYLKVDKESGGKLLNAPKNAPFPKPEEEQRILTHWAEIEVGGKRYLVVAGRLIIAGEEYPNYGVALVWVGDRWLQTFDLDKSPLVPVIQRGYEELASFCRSRRKWLR